MKDATRYIFRVILVNQPNKQGTMSSFSIPISIPAHYIPAYPSSPCPRLVSCLSPASIRRNSNKPFNKHSSIARSHKSRRHTFSPFRLGRDRHGADGHGIKEWRWTIIDTKRRSRGRSWQTTGEKYSSEINRRETTSSSWSVWHPSRLDRWNGKERNEDPGLMM
jgi:hypothetical protein